MIENTSKIKSNFNNSIS